jgi:hypothetical protein
MIEFADHQTASITAPLWMERSLRHAHPDIVKKVNARRIAMDLAPVQTRGNPLAPPPRRKQGSPRDRLAAAKQTAAAAIARLRRLQATR